MTTSKSSNESVQRLDRVHRFLLALCLNLLLVFLAFSAVTLGAWPVERGPAHGATTQRQQA